MPISSTTIDAIRSLSASVLCPLCGKFGDNCRYESLMSCGHHLCDKCVKKFVLNSNNKCPKCYAINNNNDIKDDQFINDLRKMASKLDQLVHNNNKSQKQIESNFKSVPKSQTKCAQKSQKGLIVESLKACISSVSKTKSKKSSQQENNAVQSSSKKSGSRAWGQSRAQIMVQLSGQLDLNRESVPDSYELTQDSNNLNENNDLMTKVSEIVTDLGSSSSNANNNQVNTYESNSIESESIESVNKDKINNSKTNDRLEQKSDSSNLKKYETKIPKKTLLGSKQSRNNSKSSVAVNQTDLKKNEKQHDCETNDSTKSLANKPIEAKPKEKKTFETKSVQVSYEERKPKTVCQGIQVEPDPKQVECKVTKCDASCQTEERETIQINRQTNSSHDNNSLLNRNLSELFDLNQYRTLNDILSVLFANRGNGDNANPVPIRAETVNSVQKSESIVTKNENKTEGAMTQLENFMEANESNELDQKKVPNKQARRRTDKQNTTIRNKRSAAQTKAQVKKAKANESVVKQTVCDTNAPNDLTPDLELMDNQEVGTKPVEEKMPQKVPNRPMSRNKADKKSLSDLSSSEDISEENSFEKAVLNKKLVSTETKRKITVTNRDKIDSSNDETQTKSKTNRRKRPSAAIDEKDDQSEGKSSTNSKRKPLSRSSTNVSNIIPSNDTNNDKFKCPPSPTPSIKSTSSSSSRLRTSSTERPQTTRVCILNSGLDDSQKKKCLNLAKELDAQLVTEWSDKVTHLVVGLVKDRPKKDRICQRNIKYMKALVANKWIVSFDWIIDSLRSNRFVDETNYEIKGVKNATESNAPNKSRTSGTKIFEDRIVCFKGNFSRLACDIEDLKQMVTIGGGKLIDSEKEFKKHESDLNSGKVKMISISDTIGLPNTQNGIKYISVNTFLDKVSSFEAI